MPRLSLSHIEGRHNASGLTPRGAFHPTAEDGVPELVHGAVVATVILAGNAGPLMWNRFTAARSAGPDPLDSWSRTVLERLAAEMRASPLFPGEGPPFLPFQRWAQRAEPVYPSPTGLLIHPDYGLWHGYRGALALAARLDLPAADERPSPCGTCVDKPCLTSCPVYAFTGVAYRVEDCAAHLERPSGADCAGLGCRARRACPIGSDYVYAPDQAAFHMAAFRRAQKAMHNGGTAA